ncbi:hypothetical protein ABZ845_30790 [Streptomyces sp. NPDC047022]|uniref:hypothetical protein n=1 Tax=Streptomyces sp. NPDC047022 TaxID=3155737 RepID=UPI003402BD09
MTATTAPRRSDITRSLNSLLGKDRRDAAHGWDVIANGAMVLITLNFTNLDTEAAAWDVISKRLGGRYRLEYTEQLADYSGLPEEYEYCALIEVRALTAPQETEPAPAAVQPVTVPTVMGDTVTVAVPVLVYEWLMNTGMGTGADDMDPECKETRLALEGATDHGAHRLTPCTTTVLRLLEEYAYYCEESNSSDAGDPAETAAAQLLTRRVQSARAALKTARNERAAQESETAAAVPQSGAQDAHPSHTYKVATHYSIGGRAYRMRCRIEAPSEEQALKEAAEQITSVHSWVEITAQTIEQIAPQDAPQAAPVEAPEMPADAADSEAPAALFPDDTKWRFHCNVWTPENGHQQKRYLMNGSSMDIALGKLRTVLEKRHPRIAVDPKWFERVEA